MNSRGITIGIRRILLLATLAAVTVPMSLLSSAEAADSGTSCTFEADVVASPGVSTSPSSGTVSGQEKDSVFTCDGPVSGKQPTGPGKMGYQGRYGTKDPDTCQSGGEGDGVQTMTVPTADGAQQIRNTMTFTFGAFKAGAPFSGTFEGDRMSGTMEVQPIDGDCASSPVTKYHVKGKATLHD